MKLGLAGALLAMASSSASAGMVNSVVFVSMPVPTIDDLGLFVLIGAVGAVGGWIVRRRKK